MYTTVKCTRCKIATEASPEWQEAGGLCAACRRDDAEERKAKVKAKPDAGPKPEAGAETTCVVHPGVPLSRKGRDAGLCSTCWASWGTYKRDTKTPMALKDWVERRVRRAATERDHAAALEAAAQAAPDPAPAPVAEAAAPASATEELLDRMTVLLLENTQWANVPPETRRQVCRLFI